MRLNRGRTERVNLAEILFYSTIFVLPFEQLITIGRFSIIKWVGLVFFILSLIEWRKYYGRMPFELACFLGFIGIGVTFDMVGTPATFISMNENIRPLLFFVMMLATYNLALIGRSKVIIICIFLSSLVLVFFQDTSIWSETANVYEEGAGYEDRISALGTDPNFTASFIALGVVVSLMGLFKILRSPIWVRVLCGFALVLGLSGIVKTSSRGGLLALVAGVVALAFTGKQWQKKLLALVGVCAMLGGLFYSVVQSDLFVKRIDAYVATGDTSGREMIWEQAWALILQAPYFGYGYRMHLYHLGASLGLTMRGTHNTFLATVLSSGFIGASFFMYFFIRSGWAAWQCRKDFPGNVLFCWFMICLGMGMSMNAEIAKWFWIVLSLCLGARKMQETQMRQMTADCDVGNYRGVPVSVRLNQSSSY